MTTGREVTKEGIGAGQTLFEFVRHWSRRRAAPDARSTEHNGRHVLVVEAVNSLARRGAVTINGVADEIGIDQSGASRLVNEASHAGYVALATSSADARRREIVVTASGQELLRQAHCWQEHVFTQLTEGWTSEERAEFHHAMLRILDRSRSLELLL